MATMPSAPVTAAAAASRSKPAAAPAKPRSAVRQVLSLPPRLLHMYDDFIIKNASQVSQIESALRSLTYVIPGMYFTSAFLFSSIPNLGPANPRQAASAMLK